MTLTCSITGRSWTTDNNVTSVRLYDGFGRRIVCYLSPNKGYSSLLKQQDQWDQAKIFTMENRKALWDVAPSLDESSNSLADTGKKYRGMMFNVVDQDGDSKMLCFEA